MYRFLNKNGQLIAFVVGAILVAIAVFSMVSGMSQYADAPAREVLYGESFFDFGLIAARFMAIAALVLMVIFIIRSIIMNPKGSLPLIIAAAVMAVLYFVFRASASSDITKAMSDFAVTVGQGKGISAGIWVATIMFFGAWVVLILSELRGMFK